LTALKALDTEIAGLHRKQEDLALRVQNNQGVLARAREIREAVARSEDLQARIEETDRSVQKATEQYHETLATWQEQDRQIEALHRACDEKIRLERQWSLVATVPCRGEGPYAACQFLLDAGAAREALPQADARIDELRASVGEEILPEPKDPTRTLLAGRQHLARQVTDLAPVVKQLPVLQAAAARIEELTAQRTQVAADVDAKQDERARLEAHLSDLPQLERVLREARSLQDACERNLRQHEATLGDLRRSLGVLEGRLQAIEASRATLTRIKADLPALLNDQADWTLIQRACSPSGIPTLRIDAALPELGQLASTLLRECYGQALYTIELRSQRTAVTDAAKLLEALDVVVLRDGVAVDAVLLSGGAGVLVSEAIALAISLYQAAHSGWRILTLFRDEVGAPLDAARAPAYVQMLRKAIQLGGFHQVLFVTHDPRALSLAEARLRVEGGQVTVE
jgi:DNA repair exonuclease SbcCD ATPase subunit